MTGRIEEDPVVGPHKCGEDAEVHAGGVGRTPELEPEVGDDVAAGQCSAHAGIAQISGGVPQLRMRRQLPASDGPHLDDVGVVQQEGKETRAEMARRPGQPNEDRATSKTWSASSMWRSVWVAITDVRIRARLGDTAGDTAQLT